jgi:hypothetical protein
MLQKEASRRQEWRVKCDTRSFAVLKPSDHKHAVDPTMAVSRMRRDITDDDFYSIHGDKTGKP